MRSEEKGGNLIVLSRYSKRGWKKSVTHLYYGNPAFLFHDKGKKEDPSVDKALKKGGDISLSGSYFVLLVSNEFSRQVHCKFPITCCKLVMNLRSSRVKLEEQDCCNFVAN
ncbi:hypothetical protein AVEN_17514-1 [Araneus ventricosus]|uniref:Uncharacterized protein n=1 Tax=Araneus ventricosus TaxID=182803 RepID=A0A4Y2QFA8_ARAVE|nr:hypothetical protein AVEN_17514-1 [Araneus ventricosus]